MTNKYLAKIIASDQEGLQMISACSSGAKVKVSDIKYLESNKVFLLSIERPKIETNQENKKINSICRFVLLFFLWIQKFLSTSSSGTCIVTFFGNFVGI